MSSASSAGASPRIPPIGPPRHDWWRRARVLTAAGPRPGPFSPLWSWMTRLGTRGGPCARGVRQGKSGRTGPESGSTTLEMSATGQAVVLPPAG
eukprot:4551580-Alexandrium_andersonii.AAC.1